MKRFLLIAAGLLAGISACAFADTPTSGNPVLIQVSTGVIDYNRHPGDKYNENFRIISSTVGTLITRVNSVAASTGDINSTINALNSSTASLTTSINTLSNSTSSILSALNSSSGTLLSNIGALNSSTAVFTLDISALHGSTAALRANLSNIVSTNIVTVNIAGRPFIIFSSNVLTSTFISSAAAAVDSFLLKNTTVTPGTYTNANVSVGADGRILSAANGSAGGGGTSSSSSTYVSGLIIRSTGLDMATIRANTIDVMGDRYVNVSTAIWMFKADQGGIAGGGAEASDAWYQLWGISNGSTIAVTATFGVKSASPTLPTGFTKYIWLGRLRQNASDIEPFTAFEKTFCWKNQQTAINTGTPATNLTDIDLSNFVSSGATVIYLTATVVENGGTSTRIVVKMADFGTANLPFVGLIAGASDNPYTEYIYSLPSLNSTTLQYKQDSTITIDTLIIYVLGFDYQE